MNEKDEELIKAALLIFEHCQKSECRTCPLQWKDDDSDDLYDSSCRLDASCPMYWDMEDMKARINNE